MAEGIARRIGGIRHKVFSAGIAPTVLSPLALRAMQEVGIDITHSLPKPLAQVPLNEMDYIVVLSDSLDFTGDSAAVRLFWPQADPEKAEGSEQERMDAFRKIRDELVPKVRGLFL